MNRLIFRVFLARDCCDRPRREAADKRRHRACAFTEHEGKKSYPPRA